MAAFFLDFLENGKVDRGQERGPRVSRACSQRSQYHLIKEYTLNHNIKASRIYGKYNIKASIISGKHNVKASIISGILLK